MKPEIKKLWVDALRSGEYKQGKAVLRRKEIGIIKADSEPVYNYCCLGVLCDIYRKETGLGYWNSQDEFDSGNKNDIVLTEEVMNWAEIKTFNAVLPKQSPDSDMPLALISLNDGTYDTTKNVASYTFDQIADVIEEQF